MAALQALERGWGKSCARSIGDDCAAVWAHAAGGVRRWATPRKRLVLVGAEIAKGRALHRTRDRVSAATKLSQIASPVVAQGRERRMVLPAAPITLLRCAYWVPTRRKASGGKTVEG